MPKRKVMTKTAGAVKVEDRWMAEEPEGQLAVDVFQQDGLVVVRSTIAGVEPPELEVFLNRDMLTIKGRRSPAERVEARDFLIRECYWGKFSRTIILPSDVRVEEARATLKGGVLTIAMPKAAHSSSVPIRLIE